MRNCSVRFAPVVPFDSVEQVLSWANASPVGLAAYVHTANIDRALRMSERLEAGMVGINSAAISNRQRPSGESSIPGLGEKAVQRVSPSIWRQSTLASPSDRAFPGPGRQAVPGLCLTSGICVAGKPALMFSTRRTQQPGRGAMGKCMRTWLSW